ncbi:hypothetical protein QAD02_014503 [Eretmocerus hayati]|uniref:Uncharacterized protein n=1 Tax=Eretmocerus hayati TaxID=131215 RepID=A0ACC2P758_9HYME|nr:hypothetical protein QAD02_014503 [Eretmocerus hayati]
MKQKKQRVITGTFSQSNKSDEIHIEPLRLDLGSISRYSANHDILKLALLNFFILMVLQITLTMSISNKNNSHVTRKFTEEAHLICEIQQYSQLYSRVQIVSQESTI